jgi:hypothetical protein
MKPHQLAILHLYPTLAGLSEAERRRVLLEVSGVYSCRQLDQVGFELCMAEFERLLWVRVKSGEAKDPRLCRKCGRAVRHVGGGRGRCPEGCEERQVAAWSIDYWQRRAAAGTGQAARLKHKILELWPLTQDYLDPAKQTEIYFAGIIAKAAEWPLERVLRMGRIVWSALTTSAALKTIEALKDRLHHAVGPGAQQAPSEVEGRREAPVASEVPF